MRWVAIPQVARYATFLALSAVIVTAPGRAGFIPWIETASMVVGAAIALGAVRRFGIPISIDRAAAFERPMLREALPIATSQLIWVARTYLPIVVLWYVAPRAAVAQFDVAHRLLMVLQAGLAVYLTNLYTPLSRAATGPRRVFSGLLLGSALLSGAGAFAVALLLAAYPAPILGALFGESFRAPAAVASLAVLAFVGPVITLRGHFHYALVALGRQREELRCSVIAGIALIVLLALLVPGSGVRGAAMSMLLSESLGLILTGLAVVSAMRDAHWTRAAGTPSP
jgi:O-antigen/teichoic acid export membrane protein